LLAADTLRRKPALTSGQIPENCRNSAAEALPRGTAPCNLAENIMPTALDSIINAINADPGLKLGTTAAEIQKGLVATEQLNVLLMKMITQTGANTDGLIT